MSDSEAAAVIRVPIAGFLAWLVPGLGHFYLGERARGLLLLVIITATFWTGVAIGSVQATVDPHERKLWFVAQLGTGGNTLAAYGLHRRLVASMHRSGEQGPVPSWQSAEVGVHYTGVAGLLNLIVILDALGRADPSFIRRKAAQQVPGSVP